MGNRKRGVIQMKRLWMAGVLALCLTNQVYAYYNWFPRNALVQITPGMITARIFNDSAWAIYCRGVVVGISQFGEYARSGVDGVVGPYQNITYFVRTWGNRYLVDGWSNIYCHYR